MNDIQLVEKLREQLLQVKHRTTDIHQLKPHLLDILMRLDARQLHWMCDVFFTAVSVGVSPPTEKIEVIDDSPFDDDPERDDITPEWTN